MRRCILSLISICESVLLWLSIVINDYSYFNWYVTVIND